MYAIRRFFRRNDLYFTYMLPVILAFIAIFIYLFINANYQVRDLVEQDVQSVTVSHVENVRTRMDTVLGDVQNALTQVGTSSDTLTFLKTLEEKTDTTEGLERVMRRLKEEQDFNLGVEIYGIYHKKTKTVILSEGRVDASDYLKDVLETDDPDLFSRQLEDLSDLSIWVIRNSKNGIESIVASQSYPASRHTKTASGFATLNISSLRQILREDTRNSANNLILDKDGEILLAASTDGVPVEMLKNMALSGKKTETMRSQGLFLYCIPSARTNWYYAGVASMKDYRSLTAVSNGRTIAVVLAGFLAALVVSFILSRRVTHQLDEMSDTLSRVGGGRVEEDQTLYLLYSMNQRLDRILENNRDLSETVNANRDMILEIFYRDIILQRAKPEDYTAHFTRLGIEWPKGSAFLILIRVRGDTENSPAHYRDLCRQWEGRLEVQRGEEAVFFPLQDEWIACVVSVLWEDQISQVAGRIRYYLSAILRNTPHGRFPMALSDGYPNISYLPYAYQECLNRMADQFYGRSVSGGFMESVDYPYEKERQLLNCLLSGDEEHMIERLEEFFTMNFSEHPLNLIAVDRFSHLLSGTLRRAIAEAEIPEDAWAERFQRMYQRAEEADSSEAFSKLYRNEFLWYCRTIADRRNSRSDLMSQRIRDYVADHYREDFSMADLARDLNLSMSYMSVVFKRSTGRNFADYLNRYRISVAKDLLMHTDKTISQIATDSGFISANTFIRTFKKIEGITPGQYRGAGLSDNPEERF